MHPMNARGCSYANATLFRRALETLGGTSKVARVRIVVPSCSATIYGLLDSKMPLL